MIVSCGQYKNLQTPNQDLNINKIFISWNLSTYKSIERQANTSIKEIKTDFKKQMELFKIQEDINDFEKINKNAIRYKFLEKISNQYLNISNYYIIETETLGEFYLPKVYIMYSSNKKSTNVLKYEYINRKWEYIDSFLLPKYFSYNFKKYLTKYGKGLNYNDITITHIVDNNVLSSDFFIKGSMSKFVFEKSNIEDRW